ncbi:sugar phosphate isomerase [Anaerolinea thermolimosa]|uniref:sugar phosphate isomerase/epimerase family protein n=1 Tax=Anaerolinea thermolimosa TaxID=229919 RepID=UPI000784E0FB|nr:sugar phosphate isomerase/epimerase family protein [Anaerolinea thermolimosa]GAP06760.1 sugar phosphate isomerase [Anaerolinea thermolimosa]
MYYSGFADEAGDSLDVQIRATKELGWKAIEARNIDGVNLTDLSDEQFERVYEMLSEAGVEVDCFGSAVANWSKHPRSDEDFDRSKAELMRAIPRMHRLGTKLIRGMSFMVARDEPPDNPDLEKLIFAKVKHLVRMCEDGGVIYLHENCANYGGLSYQHTLKLLEAIDSPNFRLVFDTGNPVGTDRRIGTPPYPKQSSWEFYEQVREFVLRVHIKDAIWKRDTGGIFAELEHTFPGEGHGDVRKIIADLKARGFQGALSIEPHLAVVYHDDSTKSSEEIRYANYIEYGRRLMRLVASL